MTNLFENAKAERDLAINRVDRGCDPSWIERAVIAVIDTANELGRFTVDDVQERLDRDGVTKPREGRAMGAVMTRCRRNGLILPTGTYQPSRQAHCHANPRQVWISTGARA